MKLADRMKVYQALAAPFPEEAIERTDGRVTGRGYSTTGIKAQFILNRLNEVLGPGCFRAHRNITVKPVTTPKGRTAFEAVCDLVLELGWWEDGKFIVWGEALADGGHTSFSEADARKGSFSNAMKKAAACFGVGRQAYEGTLDDDSVSDGALSPPAEGRNDYQRPRPVHDSAAEQQAQPQLNAGERATSASLPVPPGYIASPTAPTRRTATNGNDQSRSRVSSKQIAAIWSIARKAGLEQSSLRSQVKERFGVVLEFLSREQASLLIDALSRKLNGDAEGHSNGAAPPHAS